MCGPGEELGDRRQCARPGLPSGAKLGSGWRWLGAGGEVLGDGEAATADLVHDAEDVADPDRRRQAARLARRICWVWIVPLGAAAAWYAFVLLISAAFVSEAFEHELAPGAVALALGIPVGIFAAATGLGVVAASVGGRWLAALLPRVALWAVATLRRPPVGGSTGGAALREPETAFRMDSCSRKMNAKKN